MRGLGREKGENEKIDWLSGAGVGRISKVLKVKKNFVGLSGQKTAGFYLFYSYLFIIYIL